MEYKEIISIILIVLVILGGTASVIFANSEIEEEGANNSGIN